MKPSNKKTWTVWAVKDSPAPHIIPDNDLKKHDKDVTCHCYPKLLVMKDDAEMVVHNSFDGRENYEKDNLKVIN